jgi:dihydroflavonol-4-reductase
VKVFVTGATGFIGTHLVRRIAATEHELVCLVRESSTVDALEALGMPQVVGDVTDKGSLLAGMRGCDAVINLANRYSFWEPDPGVYTQVNILGTQHVMQAALENGISKVVHISTALVYGQPAVVPFTEESMAGPVRFSEYAETKFQGDRIAWRLYDEEGLPLVMLYPSGVLGPGDNKFTGRMIQNLIQRRLPGTAFHRARHNLVHVDDVVAAILAALETEGNLGEKYLISGYGLSLAEFYATVEEISGVRLPPIHFPDGLALACAWLLTGIADLTQRPPLWGLAWDAMRNLQAGLHFDGSKAVRELGITYTSLRQAIEDTITSDVHMRA